MNQFIKLTLSGSDEVVYVDAGTILLFYKEHNGNTMIRFKDQGGNIVVTENVETVHKRATS